MSGEIVGTCRVCGRGMRDRSTPANESNLILAHSADLCGSCWARHKRTGEFAPPMQRWTHDDVLHEVEFFLFWGGIVPTEIPDRLGLTHQAFFMHIRKGVRSGDERAIAWSLRTGLAWPGSIPKPEGVAA